MKSMSFTLRQIAASVLFVVIFAAPAAATLKFYYDPVTGNVAIDTRETRNGRMGGWQLKINPHGSTIRFLPENLLYLANSPFNSEVGSTVRSSTVVGGIDVSASLHGLYTVGDILPPDLTETEWTNLFAEFLHFGPYTSASQGPGSHSYHDVVGGGTPPPADFVYGKPDGRFRNLKDILDPDEIPWATAATLGYDSRTGNIWIDTRGDDGGYVSMYMLETDAGFAAAQHRPIEDGPFTESSSNRLFEAFNVVEPGKYRLGRVLPQGLTQNEFEQFFTEARFLGRAGFESASFDFANDGARFNLAFVAVPEPGAIALVMTATAACLGLARRQR